MPPTYRDDDELHAPHPVAVEIVQGLRRLVRIGELASGRAEEAIADLTDLDLHRHATSIFWVARGSCGPTSPPMTRCTSLSQRRSTRRSPLVTVRSRRRPATALVIEVID
jgi:hypothetical protein